MVNDKKIVKEEVGLLTARETRTKTFSEEQSSSNGCGLGEFFRPKWLQNFATPKTFMTVYGLLGTIQAMSYVFMVTTLTTLERRFGIPSQTTGIILSGNEISQILFSLFLSYTGGHRNRPVWLGWGVAFSAASCFVLALPHFIYGPGDQAISLTKEFVDKYGINETSLKIKEQMGLCSEQRSAKDCNTGNYSIVPPLLIFLSQFILGIGTTLSYALGQTYIDDNTKKTNTPMVFGLTLALRTIGPTIGFFVSYLCLSLYVDPSLTPLIDKKDPRWVGAWWLGWLIMGSVMLIFAFLIAMFPKKLPPKKNKVHDQANKELEADVPEKGPPPLKDFPAALKRLIKNKLLVINIFSGIFYIIGSSGYIIYLNKYIEVQFNKSTANATVLIGPAVLISMVFAFLVSGYVISKFKPGPKYLLSWNVIAGVVVVLGEITMMYVSCDDTNLVGYNVLERRIDVINTCNVDCACENLKYAPVCFEEQRLTFYSACHAGCKTTYRSDKTKAFTNCTCIPEISNLNSYQAHDGILKEGSCQTECGYNFQFYILLVSVVNFLASSGKIGNILVNYRAVLPEDKAFAQGFGLLLISLLAFIPGPILFGSIIDATCLIWDSDCGEKGNCWFYDRHAFRVNLNSTAFGLTSIGVILDAIVCYLGKDLVLYEEDEKPKNENGQIKMSSI